MRQISAQTPLFVGVLTLGLFGAGCTNPLDQLKQQAQTSVVGTVANQAVDDVTGGRVGVTTQTGEMTFTDKQTGTSYTLGTDVKMPSDFPKDIPIYPSSSILEVTSGSSASVSLKAPATVDTTTAWYDSSLVKDGWSQSSKFAYNGYESRAYAKAKEQLSLTFIGGTDSTSTVVSISLKTNP